MTEPTRAPAADIPAADENKIIAERREKLQALRQQGVAFPNDFRPTHQAAALHAEHGETDQATLEAQPVEVAIAGRMMLKRVMGKASFATLQDATGRIQVYVTRDAVGEEAYGPSSTGTWATSSAPRAGSSRPAPASCPCTPPPSAC